MEAGQGGVQRGCRCCHLPFYSIFIVVALQRPALSLAAPTTTAMRKEEEKNSLKLQNFFYFLFTTPSFPFSHPTLLPFALRFSFLLFVLFLSLSVCLCLSVSVALYLSVLFHFRFVLLNLFASFLICTSLHFIVIYNLICTAIAPSPSHSPPLLSCISICI